MGLFEGWCGLNDSSLDDAAGGVFDLILSAENSDWVVSQPAENFDFDFDNVDLNLRTVDSDCCS